ncbi:hypothetical protein SSTU70S_03298 [Stutzerimonas stutzeri]
MSRSQEFLHGCRDILPLVLGAIPFGIIFGTLSIAAGLSFWQTLGMSALVFAGSAQFIAVTLISGGVGAAVVLLTTFVVNLRHALYSAALQPFVRHLRAAGARRWPSCSPTRRSPWCSSAMPVRMPRRTSTGFSSARR